MGYYWVLCVVGIRTIISSICSDGTLNWWTQIDIIAQSSSPSLDKSNKYKNALTLNIIFRIILKMLSTPHVNQSQK